MAQVYARISSTGTTYHSIPCPIGPCKGYSDIIEFGKPIKKEVK